MEDKELEFKKRQLHYWQELARNRTKEAGKAVRRADKLQKEVYELENKEKTPEPPVS